MTIRGRTMQIAEKAYDEIVELFAQGSRALRFIEGGLRNEFSYRGRKS